MRLVQPGVGSPLPPPDGRGNRRRLGRGVHPDDLDRCVKTYLDAFHQRQAFEMEYRLRAHDGQFRWIIDCGRPFLSSSEEFAGYVGYCFDVSEYRNMEAALNQREELLREAQEVGQMGTTYSTSAPIAGKAQPYWTAYSASMRATRATRALDRTRARDGARRW